MTHGTGDGDRVRSDVELLAQIGRDTDGGISRPAFSPADLEARRWLMGRMTAAGLDARLDAAGNVVGRLAATRERPDAAAVVLGSHLDTVRGGGPLDGALGVLAGLEVARRLREAAVPRHRPLEVVAFSDEEGRFGDYLGSRAFTGTLSLGGVADLRDSDGVRLIDALAATDLSADALTTAARPAGAIGVYLELHVEQGPVLEAAGLTIGIVTGIVGQLRFEVDFDGRRDHAGTTPMTRRRDAFAAAALFATRLRDRVLSRTGSQAVLTIGTVHIEPGIRNVVPGRATLGVDARDVEVAGLEQLGALVHAEAEAAGTEHGVAVRARRISGSPPVPLDARLQKLIEQEVEQLGLRHSTLPSGAGHDAKIMASRVPSAMIFVPSRGGRSHCPEEVTDWADIEAGVTVLLRTVARLLGGAEDTGDDALPADAPVR